MLVLRPSIRTSGPCPAVRCCNGHTRARCTFVAPSVADLCGDRYQTLDDATRPPPGTHYYAVVSSKDETRTLLVMASVYVPGVSWRLYAANPEAEVWIEDPYLEQLLRPSGPLEDAPADRQTSERDTRRLGARALA